MKLEFNIPIIGLNGNIMKSADGTDVIAGRVLAQHLWTLTKGDSIKIADWALKLYALQPIDVSAEDIAFLDSFLDADETMYLPVKAQIKAVWMKKD